MATLLKKSFLWFGVSLCFCLGLTGCSTGPTFYDEAAPLVPPPFTPPPLKAVEAPLSSENLDDVAPLDSQSATGPQLESGLLHSDQPPVAEATTSGPLSSPMATLSKKVVLSKNNDGTLKKR